MNTELIVFSSGSAEPGLGFVADAFRKETGYTVIISFNLGAQGPKQLKEGVACDVVVATSNAIDRDYRPAGLVEDGGISIGRVGIGVTMRPGAPVPDISSANALKRAVLDAEAILLTSETSGLYVEEMLRKLGIHEQAKVKFTYFHNGPSLMDGLLKGRGREFGFLSPNAVRTYRDKGLVLVGLLPDEVQFYREFIAVPTASGKNKEVAWQFVRYCGGRGKALMVANGFI